MLIQFLTNIALPFAMMGVQSEIMLCRCYMVNLTFCMVYFVASFPIRNAALRACV